MNRCRPITPFKTICIDCIGCSLYFIYYVVINYKCRHFFSKLVFELFLFFWFQWIIIIYYYSTFILFCCQYIYTRRTCIRIIMTSYVLIPSKVYYDVCTYKEFRNFKQKVHKVFESYFLFFIIWILLWNKCHTVIVYSSCIIKMTQFFGRCLMKMLVTSNFENRVM